MTGAVPSSTSIISACLVVCSGRLISWLGDSSCWQREAACIGCWFHVSAPLCPRHVPAYCQSQASEGPFCQPAHSVLPLPPISSLYDGAEWCSTKRHNDLHGGCWPRSRGARCTLLREAKRFARRACGGSQRACCTGGSGMLARSSIPNPIHIYIYIYIYIYTHIICVYIYIYIYM